MSAYSPADGALSRAATTAKMLSLGPLDWTAIERLRAEASHYDPRATP